MTKIKELINIHSGYAEYVNLVQEFNDPAQNRARMQQYMPIKSHREAFTKLSRALYPMDNRVYLLTGSYGTGKSHLCLMLANYLAYKPSEPELQIFFENWASREVTEAEKLRNLRGDGRYLVALCEYGTGDDFDSMVLRAIAAAVDREQIGDVWLDTHYQEAVRQIERWEKRQQQGMPSGTFNDFQAELATHPQGRTLAKLKKDLDSFDQEALTVFRELHRGVIGSEFSYSKDNLVAILQDFLTNPRFKERFKGLTVIADEFGYILDRGQIRVDVFQRFAEMCHQGVGGSQLMFVGTGHKAFQTYAAGKLSAVDFRVAADRVEEIPLESEELELIIGAIVEPDKAHSAWNENVAKQVGTFNRVALGASRLGLFQHLKAPEVRSRVIEDIYPMHPVATHCLIELSTEVGSDARSVFKFFSGALETEPPEGSYGWYINRNDVIENGKLNLYTADALYTYFRNELRPETAEAREAVRQHIRNYEASLREVRKQAQTGLIQEVDELVERVLKLLLIFEISKISPTLENLAFGLYLESPADKSKLSNRLDKLVEQKALFQSATGIYEFRSSRDMDFETLIEQYLSDPNNVPADMASEVVNLVSLGRGGQWLEAKNHNQPYSEDKRLLRVFAQASDLEGQYPIQGSGEKGDYFAYLASQLSTVTEWKDRYEGVAAYVLCETDEEVVRAKEAAEKNQSKHVVVGIPRQPIPIQDAIMHLRAAQYIQQTQDLDALSLQDRTRLQEDIIGDERRKTGYMGEFVRIRDRYLGATELSWYGAGGKLLIAQPQSEYEPADELMRDLYTQRNQVPHPYLNQIHSSRFDRDVPLTDAVNKLLRTHQLVEIDHSLGDNRGEIRYLKKVLADSGALDQAASTYGNIARYQVEPNVNQFQEKLPALAGMIAALRALEQGKTLPVRRLLTDHAAAPYGQGPVALSLFLAHTIRTFGDELRLQLQPGQVGYATMNDANLIVQMVDGKHPNAIFERQPISAEERALINDVYRLFSDEPGAAGENHTVREAYDVLRNWWNAQPRLAQAPDIYGEGKTAHDLVTLLRDIEGLNPYRLVLEQLKVVYGLLDDQVITAADHARILQDLKADKATIERAPTGVKERLLQRIMKLEAFSPQGDHYSDYQQAVHQWYANLGEEQKDSFAPWHSHPSKAVVSHLQKVVNIEDTFLKNLPADSGFGLGQVDNWNSDRGDQYIQILQNALKHIEANRVKVPPPQWDVSEAQEVNRTGTAAQVTFRKGVTLVVEPPEPGVKVLLTDGGEDPREATQRETVTDRFELRIQKGALVKLVSQGADGSYGRVVTLSFVDADSKYRVAPLTEQQLWEKEYKFVFPKDEQALEVLLTSILKDVLEKNVVTEEQAQEILQNLVANVRSLY